MTMRLTLTLPASAAELRDYLDACDSIGIGTIDLGLAYGDESVLTASLGTATPVAAPPAEPAPEAIAKALPHAAKVTKGTAKKAPAKKKAASAPGPGGDTAEAIVTALEKVGGRWDGSAWVRHGQGGLGHHALNVLPKLAIAGRLRLLKPSPTGRVTAIELVNGATPGNVTPISQPVAPRQPAAPATPPTGGLKPPSGGWA